MNVPRRIGYSIGAAVVLTAVAVAMFPDLRLVQYAVPLLTVGTLAVLVLAGISFYREEELTMHDKNLLMNGFLVAILVPTLYTAGAFVHESQTSWSQGEQHFHADFEVIVENESGEVERKNLISPEEFCKTTEHESSLMCKLNDRTGSTEYHEHSDNRIHLEGTFKQREDATLSAFFEQFEGELTNTRMVFPTNEEVVEVEDNGGTLKIAVRRTVGTERQWCMIGDKAPQGRMCNSYAGPGILDEIPAESPSEYVVSPYTQGPNLDDIFIIYDSRNPQQVLNDLEDDGRYRGIGLQKSGGGYSE